MKIERAAMTATAEDIAVKLRNAPAWVRSAANVSGRAVSPSKPAAKAVSKPTVPMPAAKPTARAKAPVIGWLAGTCCPGVSRPLAHSRSDGETLPEQFTPEALARMLAKAAAGDGVPVTFGHDGPVIATTRILDVMLRVDRITGLQFDVRVRDTAIGRKVLAEVEGRSLGVSIGFSDVSSWIVERDGIGRLRVVDDAVLDHVAILPRSATLKPVYAGARCYGLRGNGPSCPQVLYRDATAWAFRFIASQAGVRT